MDEGTYDLIAFCLGRLPASIIVHMVISKMHIEWVDSAARPEYNVHVGESECWGCTAFIDGDQSLCDACIINYNSLLVIIIDEGFYGLSMTREQWNK